MRARPHLSIQRNRSRASIVLIALVVVLAGSGARAAGVDPETARAPEKAQAQAYFAKARAAFEAGDFARALREARASWEVVASPNARLFISRCLREMGKLAEAYVEYGATMDDAGALARKEPRYAETARAATSERAEVEPRIGKLVVNVERPADDTVVSIQGQPISRAAWATPLAENPGTVLVVVQEGGREMDRKSATVAAGTTQSVSVEGAPPPPPEVAPTTPPPVAEDGKRGAKLRTAAYATAGVGAAGFVLFAVFGALNNSTYGDLESACHAGVCPASKAGEISTGRTEQIVGNVGLGVGIAGVAAGATLFALSFTHGSSMPAKDATTSIVVSPTFVGLRGEL
jgi:hypothetical protein